jgi:hypothetical protein
MQNLNLLKTVMPYGMPVPLPEAKAQGVVNRQAEEHQKNGQFVTVLNAFRASGGLAREQEVATRIKNHRGDEVSPLAGWLSKRQICSFEWQSKLWIPMFQFNPSSVTLRTGLNAVLSELAPVYDDWEIATWFAEPNPWLADCSPADVLAVAPTQVHHAARTERFVQAG